MRCVCGEKFPVDEDGNVTSTFYPITPQMVTMVNDKGNKVITWETYIVKCEAEIGHGKLLHPDGTEWNYVEQAKIRDGEPVQITKSSSTSKEQRMMK